MNCHCHPHGFAEGHYVLPQLPYEFEALEPEIDAQTLRIHYERHHAAYVSGANQAMEQMRTMGKGEANCAAAAATTRDLAFHLGGHILHCLYWKSMSPTPKSEPEGALREAIARSFGSLEGFLKLFRCLCLSIQGSGWAVLGVDALSCRPVLAAMEKHQDALSPSMRPLLVCDVWEHAYYLQYQNKRADYVDGFLARLDWSHAEKSFNAHALPHE